MPKLFNRCTILALAAPALALASGTVMAHTGALGHHHGGGMAHSLMQGALHPVTGVDHLAAMVSVGLWSALSRSTDKRSLWAQPTAFAATLLLGAVLGLFGLTLPGVEPMIAMSLLVLGLLVSTRLAMPATLGSALVAMFALFHGVAHGAELQGAHAWAALAGMVATTAVLHGVGILGGQWMRRQGAHGAGRWMAGLTGAGVAGFGAMLLAPVAMAGF